MMKRRNVVMGVILASVLIAAIIIQATFGVSVGGGVKVIPTEMPITQNTTKTFTIILQSAQSDNFDVTIIPGTCERSWFSWLETPRVRVEQRDPTQLYVDFRPTDSGVFYFKVIAKSSRGDLFESEDILIFSEPPPTPTPTPSPSPTPTPTALPRCIGLVPDLPSPQKIMTKTEKKVINWTAFACDHAGDTLEYRFCEHREGLLGWNCTGWSTSNKWPWNVHSDETYATAFYDIIVDVRNAKHNTDDWVSCEYLGYQITINNAPYDVACLIPDKFPPQYVGAAIKWTACARDPEGDQDTLYYRFVVDGHRRSNWSKDNTWIWDTMLGNYGAGYHNITVWVTDSWDPPLPEDPRQGEAHSTFEYLLEP